MMLLFGQVYLIDERRRSSPSNPERESVFVCDLTFIKANLASNLVATNFPRRLFWPPPEVGRPLNSGKPLAALVVVVVVAFRALAGARYAPMVDNRRRNKRLPSAVRNQSITLGAMPNLRRRPLFIRCVGLTCAAAG